MSNNATINFKMSFLKNRQLFFIPLLLLVIPFPPIAALIYHPDGSLIYRDCAKNFTNNELLQSNINSLVTDIKVHAPLHRFAIASSGADYDTVYGVARCQDDMSREECSVCISDVADKIRAECLDASETRAWGEKCFLHYDTSNFIGKADTIIAAVWFSYSEAENPKVFEKRVADLMAVLMEVAAGRGWRFSWGENLLEYDGGVTIYGMAQCTQDLDESECSQCLKTSLEIMTKKCGSHEGCRIFGSSCVMRYEIYEFLEPSEGYAPAPAPSLE